MHLYHLAQHWHISPVLKGIRVIILGKRFSPVYPKTVNSVRFNLLVNHWEAVKRWKIYPIFFCTAGFLASFHPSEIQLCCSPHFISPWEPWRVESAFQAMCITETLLAGEIYCSLSNWNSMFSLNHLHILQAKAAWLSFKMLIERYTIVIFGPLMVKNKTACILQKNIILVVLRLCVTDEYGYPTAHKTFTTRPNPQLPFGPHTFTEWRNFPWKPSQQA